MLRGTHSTGTGRPGLELRTWRLSPIQAAQRTLAVSKKTVNAATPKGLSRGVLLVLGWVLGSPELEAQELPPPPISTPEDPTAALMRAEEHRQAGRLSDAESLLRQVLAGSSQEAPLSEVSRATLASLLSLLADAGRGQEAASLLTPYLATADRCPDVSVGPVLRLLVARALLVGEKPVDSLPWVEGAVAGAVRGSVTALVPLLARAWFDAISKVDPGDSAFLAAARDLSDRLSQMPGFAGISSLVDSLWQKGMARIQAGDGEDAARDLDLAVRLARAGVERERLPALLNALGHAAARAGNPQRAREVLEDGLTMTSDPALRVSLLANLALAAQEEGDVRGAADGYARAAAEARAGGEVGRAFGLEDAGVRALWEGGFPREALKAATALREKEGVELRHRVSAALVAGGALLLLEEWGQAQALLVPSLEEIPPDPISGGLLFPDAASLLAAGGALATAHRGDPDGAAALARRALALAQETGEPLAWARTYELVADAAARGVTGRDPVATCHEAEEALRKAGLEDATWRSSRCVAEALVNQGEYRLAHNAREEAWQRVERIGLERAREVANPLDRLSPLSLLFLDVADPHEDLSDAAVMASLFALTSRWHSLMAEPPHRGGPTSPPPSVVAPPDFSRLSPRSAVVSFLSEGWAGLVTTRRGVLPFLLGTPPSSQASAETWKKWARPLGKLLRGKKLVYLVPDGLLWRVPLASVLSLPGREGVTVSEEMALALDENRHRPPAPEKLLPGPLALHPSRPSLSSLSLKEGSPSLLLSLPEAFPGAPISLRFPGVTGEFHIHEGSQASQLGGHSLASALGLLSQFGVESVTLEEAQPLREDGANSPPPPPPRTFILIKH